MANIGELRELDDRELLLRHHDVVQDLVGLKFQAATGQLDNTAQLKRLRRELAKIKTLVRQRELEQELSKGGLAIKEKSVRDEIGKGYSKIQERYGKRV
jgi:large subunit ribosomal protein L29